MESANDLQFKHLDTVILTTMIVALASSAINWFMLPSAGFWMISTAAWLAALAISLLLAYRNHRLHCRWAACTYLLLAAASCGIIWIKLDLFFNYGIYA